MDSSNPSETGINAALLAALPPAARVLELGCADGRLGQRYKHVHPAARWTGVDRNPASVAEARAHLDDVLAIDLETGTLEAAGTNFDLIVLGDVLEHLREPHRVLGTLHDVCTPDARLALCMPNMSNISVIERLVFGDIMYDEVGLLDRTHLRMFSPRSVFKLLLDCGWLPSAVGGYNASHPNARFTQSIMAAAAALGISTRAAEINMLSYQIIITCKRDDAPAGPPAERPNLAVIVPLTNEPLAALNAARSPGFTEIDARVMPLRGGTSAAAVCRAAAAQSSADWFLFCREELYFPSGSGNRIAALLASIDPADAPGTAIGFAGIALDSGAPARSGRFVEQFRLVDEPATDRAVSIADCAVLMHRDLVAAIDPDLGWHLWATDLCLQSIERGRYARVARVPFLWNAIDEVTAEVTRGPAATALARKYPGRPAIPTFYGPVASPAAAVL